MRPSLSDKRIDTLIPAVLSSKAEIDKRYIGKTITFPVLKARDGTLIAEKLSPDWMRYIADAINNYHQTREPKNTLLKTPEPAVLARFVVSGTPMEKKDAKTISQNKDGTFLLCANQDWVARVKQVKKSIGKNAPALSDILNNKDKLSIEMVFYMQKKNPPPCLSGLISGTLEIFKKIGIIKDISCETVVNTDKSRVEISKSIEYTVIVVRRYIREG